MTTLDKEKQDEGQRKGDDLSDRIRGAITSGVKSVLVSQESVRNVLSDFIPKEISTTVKAHLEGMKKELYSGLVNEFTAFLSKIDLAGELRRALSGLKVTVRAEIEFSEPDESKPKKRPGR